VDGSELAVVRDDEGPGTELNREGHPFRCVIVK
jgi:hypothetical protein